MDYRKIIAFIVFVLKNSNINFNKVSSSILNTENAYYSDYYDYIENSSIDDIINFYNIASNFNIDSSFISQIIENFGDTSYDFNFYKFITSINNDEYNEYINNSDKNSLIGLIFYPKFLLKKMETSVKFSDPISNSNFFDTSNYININDENYKYRDDIKPFSSDFISDDYSILEDYILDDSIFDDSINNCFREELKKLLLNYDESSIIGYKI